MSPCSSELAESESLEDDEELEDEDDEELDLLGRWMCISGIEAESEELSLDEELPLDDEELPLDIESMSSFDEDALPLSRCGGGPPWPCLSGA